jgi:uncharacterized spore protein YtfJ
MDMISSSIDAARDATTVRRVYGEPIERDGTTIIPAAVLQGGGGGGSGEGSGPDGTGTGTGRGGGWGVKARPVGAFVIRDGTARWEPALDMTRIIVGGQAVAIVALLTLRAWLRRRR